MGKDGKHFCQDLGVDFIISQNVRVYYVFKNQDNQGLVSCNCQAQASLVTKEFFHHRQNGS